MHRRSAREICWGFVAENEYLEDFREQNTSEFLKAETQVLPAENFRYQNIVLIKCNLMMTVES